MKMYYYQEPTEEDRDVPTLNLKVALSFTSAFHPAEVSKARQPTCLLEYAASPWKGPAESQGKKAANGSGTKSPGRLGLEEGNSRRETLTILHKSHRTPCRLLRHCACAAV